MINEYEEVSNQHNLNDSFTKSRAQDDTLSLQSDRSSQGYINEKVDDWPAWTINDNQSETVSVQTHTQAKSEMIEEPTVKPIQQKVQVAEIPIVIPTVGSVNEQQIAKLLATKAKLPPKRYGRGMLRYKRLQQEQKINEAAQKKDQNPKDIPTYNATNNN